MSAFLLALLLVPSAKAIDMSRLDTKDSAVAYAQEISAKTTESEQTILKTLLGERAHWHPDAPSLLEEVDKRDGDKWRRLNGEGRRLAGYQVGERFYCDGGTEAECNNLVDDQCHPCKWSGFSCSNTKCNDYTNATTCCANAGKVATGCRWQISSWSSSKMECVENTCDKIIDQKDMSDANAETACNAAAGCFFGCEESFGTKSRKCIVGKASDFTCTCSEPAGKCERKSTGNEMQQLGQALGALGNAVEPTCNLMDCAKCLKDKKCSEKKSAAASSAANMCKSKCEALTQCEAETECLFCGPKKGASCTPRVASPPTTCGAPPVVAEANPPCDKACSDAKARCPSSCAAGGRRLADARRLDFKCFDKNAGNDAGGAQQGAVITTGAAIVAIMGTMLH